MAQLLTAGVAFVLTALGCKWLIPWLQARQWVQDGPRKEAKKLPAMGGIALGFGMACAIIFGVAVTLAFADKIDGYAIARLVSGFCFAVGLGLLGFVDDYLRIVKQRANGLGRLQKLLIELCIAAAFLFTLQATGVFSTWLEIPFFGTVDFGVFSYLLMMALILGVLQAGELFEQQAGVNPAIAFVASLGFSVFFMTIPYFSDYAEVFAAAVAGMSLGVLLFCLPPVKLMLGNSGVLFLNGLLLGVAFACDLPLFLVPILLVYWVKGGALALRYVARELHGKTWFSILPLDEKGIGAVTKVAVITAIMSIVTYFAVSRLF